MEKGTFIKIEAIQIAEDFNIKKLKAEFGVEPHSSSPSEIFYTLKKLFKYVEKIITGVLPGNKSDSRMYRCRYGKGQNSIA